MPTSPRTDEPIPLSIAGQGHDLIVSRMDCTDYACRLRELGLCEGRVVRVIGGSDPMVCILGCTRFALAKRLAASIFVRRRIPAPACG